jgi:hypothetical protein
MIHSPYAAYEQLEKYVRELPELTWLNRTVPSLRQHLEKFPERFSPGDLENLKECEELLSCSQDAAGHLSEDDFELLCLARSEIESLNRHCRRLDALLEDLAPERRRVVATLALVLGSRKPTGSGTTVGS